MHGSNDVRCECGFEEFAAALRYAEGAAEKRLRGGGTEANDDFGLEQSEFGVEPRSAGGDFGAVWFFVDAAFAARLPFEMFDGVGDVGFVAVDAGLFERGVEQFSCWADERLALAVFLIAGLLSDKDDSWFARAVSEDGLRGAFVEVAGFASFGASAGVVDGFGDGQRRRGGRRGIFGGAGFGFGRHEI